MNTSHKSAMPDTVILSLEINRDSLSALRMDSERFILEMRLAAAVKWYELGLLSQSKAAEVAGISRVEFLTSLSRYQASPFQYRADEIANEAKS